MRYPTPHEAFGVIALLLIVVSVWKAHRDPAIRLNVFDLLIGDDGRISKTSCVFMGSWAALTYVFVGLYFRDKITDTLFAAYGAVCFAPLITKMLSGPSTTTISTSSTTEVKEEKKC